MITDSKEYTTTKHFSFLNYPNPTSFKIYEDSRKWFVKHLLKCRGVVSIYETGTVCDPGISDLDFLVVLDESFNTSDRKFFDDAGWPKPLKRLIGGESILKTNEDIFPHLQKIDQKQMFYLAGKRLPQFKVENEGAFFKICQVLDWLPERIFQLSTQFLSGRLDITRTLLLLKSTTLSLSLFDELFPSSDCLDLNLPERIEQLRGEWFFNDEVENLTQLLEITEDTITQGLDIVGFLAEQLERRSWIVAPNIQEGLFKINDGFEFFFSKSFKRDEPFSMFTEKEDRSFVLTLPLNLYAYFAYHGASSGTIRNRIREALYPYQLGEVHAPLKEIIDMRMDLCDENAIFLEERGISSGLVKYGWFLNKRSIEQELEDAFVNDSQKRKRMYDLEYSEIKKLTSEYFLHGRVLDIGCGDGSFTSYFIQDGWTAHGVEVRPEVRKVAEKKGVQCGQYDYPPGSFDVIVMRGVIQHLENVTDVLYKAKMLLKNRGLLCILANPNTDSLCYRLFHELPVLIGNNHRTPIYSPYGEKELKQMLEVLDLEVVKTRFPYWGTPYASPMKDLISFGQRLMGEKKVFPFWGNMLEMYAIKRKANEF